MTDDTLKKVAIIPLPGMRKGIPIQFSGQQVQVDANGRAVEDAAGDLIPLSEYVDIELIVPPLNLDSLQEFERPLALMGTAGVTASESLSTLQRAIKHALRRNYRGVPDWLIAATLDVGNLEELSVALMDVNGLKRKEIEAGKAKAAAEALQTGTQSTAPSSPIPATPGL